MKTAIIGCGWVGLPLAKMMVQEGYEVVGSTTNSKKANQLSEEGISGFIYSLEENTEIDKDICEGTELLIITIPPIRREDPNFYGNCLGALVEQFKNLKKIIFLSSIGIYPKRTATYSEEFSFLEREKANPLFHAEKVLKEKMGEHLTILRLGGLFGPGRHPALNLQGRSDVENPTGTINLVHLEDVNRAILHVINEDAAGIFNVVYPEHPWRKEYYTQVFRKYNLQPIKFVISHSVERKIDTRKLRDKYGFEFTHSIYDLEDSVGNQ